MAVQIFLRHGLSVAAWPRSAANDHCAGSSASFLTEGIRHVRLEGAQPGLDKFHSGSVFEPGLSRWHHRQRLFYWRHHEIIKR
jgi:hypothetical protein